ncbi:MAG: phage head-tail connector protein [Phycisphaeraceae bacterium]|nr:phage head-tail connector protein [Phycisphaeraceae bacterium]
MLTAAQTVRNAAIYQFVSQAASPVNLATMKSYLKITATADDVLTQSMIDAVTEWGEKYTGRDFRAITWDLLLDLFTDRIELRRDPVASFTTVKHLVDAALVTVPNTVYYLKKLVQSSEILLNEDQEWPTDTDNREQAIEIRFVTKGYRCQKSIIDAIERHVAFWYRNRGDCPNVKASAEGAGVTAIYNQFRISRV